MSKRKVAYYYDNDVGLFSYGLGHPMKPHRMRMTHDLVSSYGMLNKMQILRPKRASPERLTAFHTDEYVHFLSRVTPETAEELTGHGTRFLVGEDNPAFEGIFEFCSISAGGSIDAANNITSGGCDIAINWAGGLHHAKKREASGFCYINDIVLAILELLRTFPRVLYIDIDCHHGDGVEEAFYTTDRVLTCSFHKFGEYFPGTGHVDDHGRDKGQGYAVNVPLRDGLTDETFRGVFRPIIQHILDWYQPSAVVLQCGADSLSGDKLGCFNLTMEGHASCVQYLRKSGLPLILVGGGGYTIKNVARTWAYETACALGVEDTIDRNLPWNAYFEWFGPRYRLEVAGNNMEDLNPKDGYLDSIKEQVIEQLRLLPFAPSVGQHEVPRESLGEHLGFVPPTKEEPEEKDELDEKLGQQFRKLYTARRNESSSSDSDEPESLDSEDDGLSTSSRHRDRRRARAPDQHLFPHRYAKRMSLLDSPHANSVFADADGSSDGGVGGLGAPRRFFGSGVVWDSGHRAVVLRDAVVNGMGSAGRVGDVMARGAGGGTGVGVSVDAMDVEMGEVGLMDDDWKDADIPISVES